ncbi:carboxyltransferase domain-containing protein [Lacrimispora xylanisolvens]|uniref:carboxyltransferase domain-containing protein n=1 Tax=Lacrimispora xylanisolvens TaxID=384636 RepID=UPI002402B5BF
MKIKAVGDRGVLLELGDTIDETVNRQVMELNQIIMAASIEGITESVPAFCSVLVCYDPLITDYNLLSGRLEKLSKTVTSGNMSGGRLVEIPVCYGGRVRTGSFLCGRACREKGTGGNPHSQQQRLPDLYAWFSTWFSLPWRAG